MKQISFRSSDTGPRRAQQLTEMSAGLCNHEQRIGSVEEQVGSASPSGTPGDPGDMTLWFENALV